MTLREGGHPRSSSQSVVIPVGRPGAEDNYAVAYARRLLPKEIRLFHAHQREPHRPTCRRAGDISARSSTVAYGADIRTEIRNLRARGSRPISRGHAHQRDHPRDRQPPGWMHVLHNLRVQRIKATLVGETDVVVTNVAHHRLRRARARYR